MWHDSNIYKSCNSIAEKHIGHAIILKGHFTTCSLSSQFNHSCESDSIANTLISTHSYTYAAPQELGLLIYRYKNITVRSSVSQLQCEDMVTTLFNRLTKQFIKLRSLTIKIHAFQYHLAYIFLIGVILKKKLEKIKDHGHWKCDAVWTYLRSEPRSSSCITQTFKHSIL